ncbi:MAG: hypothetical protein HFE59_05535 [Clostridiales bacterium]|nr:hypothetical protein [Clostridiales bacterium]
MFCLRKVIGIICLSLGIGMLLSLIMPWFNFFTSLILIAFGVWELIQNNC